MNFLSPLEFVSYFFQGFAFPAGYELWSQWAPPLERAKLATLNPAGTYQSY